jgi:sulfatase maturation enzyme AslB (radical SAM superfamily)
MFNTDKFGKITLEVELTTFCNLFCPGCKRYRYENNTLHKNNNVIYNQYLDPNIFKHNLFEGPNSLLWKQIEFIGTYGDPLGHKGILDICEAMVSSRNKRIKFFFHTNGTLGNETVWKELAKFCNIENRYITFSVDDLGEDNGKYRIGQTWELIERNMNTFISNGGWAEWKMVIFKHNKHKVPLIKEYSKKIGCKKFRSVLDYNESDRAINFLERPITLATPLSDNFVTLPKPTPDHNIKCLSLAGSAIYLTVNGDILPCCMWNASRSESHETGAGKEIYNWLGKDWNNASKHDIKTILDNNRYQKDFFDMLENKPLRECYSSCDKTVGSADTLEAVHDFDDDIIPDHYTQASKYDRASQTR